MENYLVYGLGALALVAIIYTGFMTYKTKSAKQLTLLKEEVLMLFIFAEKQEWIGVDKMKWVVGELYKKFPNGIKMFVPEDTVESYVVNLYNEFKVYLKDSQVKEAEAVVSTETTNTEVK